MKRKSKKKKKIFTKKNIQKMILLFFIGSMIGWVYELFFYAIFEQRWTNSGLTFAPFVTIYGIGAWFLLMLKPVRKHPILVFLGSLVITGIVEYVGGWILLEGFGMRLWDYRDKFMNLDGFICLRSVLVFAFAGLFEIYILEPWLDKLKYKKKSMDYIVLAFLILFLIDVVVSMFLKTPYLYPLMIM